MWRMTMPSTAALTAILGGPRALKMRIGDAGDLRRGVEEGLPYAALEAVMKGFGFSREDVTTALRIPARTLARRKRAGRLAPDESDRLIRLAHLASEAARILGTDQKAAGWLRDTNMALGGEVPLRLLATEIGARQVEEVLGHIEYGLVS